MSNKLPAFLVHAFLLMSMFITFNAHSSENACLDYYFAHSDTHYAFNFFKKFRNDYLPFSAQRASRKKDKYDIYLLEQSYAQGSIHKPIEMGMVELLDRKGNVLDYTTVTGIYGHIYGLNHTARNLLNRNSHQIDKVYMVRKRHTHPKELHQTIIPEAFSDGDMRTDQTLRIEMDTIESYRRIRLESWITFLNINLFTHDPVELVYQDVGIRGYLVK